MRVVFLNRFFWPDISATSQLLADLAFGLAEDECRQVIVITSRLRYDGSGRAWPAREEAQGVSIFRVWTSGFGRARVAGRALDYLTFIISAAWTLARTAGRGDVVVIMTDPPMLSLVAHAVARLKGARVVNWLQDIFPEVACALGHAPGPIRLAAAVLAWGRNLGLRRADANVVIGRRMAARVASLTGGQGRPIEICNWADGDVVAPIDDHPAAGLRAAWGLTDAFVVAYSGNLGRAHDVDTLLDGMQRLQHDPARRRVVWLLVGGGAQFRILQAEVVRHGLRDVVFRPYQPRPLLAQSLGVADVHLISLQPALEGLMVPSKLYGILAAGRPALFIGALDGEVARVLAEIGCGATVAPCDGAALAGHVRAWCDDPERIAEMGRRARAAFVRQYDKPQALARWRALLDRFGA